MTTLVLIPGHMCGAWLYAPQLAAFPEARLADVTRDDSVAGMAARLLAETEGPLILAGLSLGGMVAMEAIAAAPERIAGACLMATDPGPASDREIAWRAGLVTEGLAHYRETFVGRFYRHDAAVAARLGPMTLAHMAETTGAVTHAQIRALDSRRDMLPRIAAYAGPVEIVCGAEDRVCPPEPHRRLAEALGGAHLTEIGGTGHIATLESPGPCTDAIAALVWRLR